jgi:hypothetical protein
MFRDSFHAHLTELRRADVKHSAMGMLAASLAFHAMELENLFGRAAQFRIEADALRKRAAAMDEDVIRDQYLLLADRWAMLAAGLEAEQLAR